MIPLAFNNVAIGQTSKQYRTSKPHLKTITIRSEMKGKYVFEFDLGLLVIMMRI